MPELLTLSHSRAKQYAECGWKYKLIRVDKTPEPPSVALAAGSAFHKWAECHDRTLVEPKIGRVQPGSWEFAEYFAVELAALAEGSGIEPADFRVSGRKTKDRPSGETIDYWSEELGPLLCQKYIEHRWPNGWSLCTDLPPDSAENTVGVEYHVRLDLPGLRWQGYYDRIFVDQFGNLVVVDLKTWQRPRLSTQLAEYMVAGQMLGLRTVFGAYYNARTGELGPVRACTWDEQTFRDYVAANSLGIESGLFIPNVGDHCGWCSVRETCEFAP